MNNEQRKQQMMDAAEAYAAGLYSDESVCFSTEENICETINDFCAGWRAADQRPQWIPVEERKPNDGQVVFIYTKHGSVSSVKYKDGAFNLNEVLEAINVTHWMPMPQPPQGKEPRNE